MRTENTLKKAFIVPLLCLYCAFIVPLLLEVTGRFVQRSHASFPVWQKVFLVFQRKAMSFCLRVSLKKQFT